MARTTVEILNSSLSKVGEIKNLYPLNKDGMVLRYTKELSDYGQCLFRVHSNDPIFDQLGDILQPHVYHVRIKRGTATVWAGAIVDNTQRNRNFIEVRAFEYEYYLDKVLIRRDSEVVTGDGKNNYRTFSSGTMAAAVTGLIQKAATDFGSAHPLGSMTVGTVNNPNYPSGMVDGNGQPLSGAWSFSSTLTLQFDYHSVYYVLKQFGIYTNCDFEVDENRIFNWKTFLGNKENNITFEYSTQGNVVDYNTPRLGRRMVNDVWGIAATTDGIILNANERDNASVQTYGLLQDAIAYADVKDKNFLTTRLREALQFTKTPDDAPVNILLNEKGYPLGQYDIGDIVTVKITDNVISYSQPRRIVGITVNLHDTGRELTTIQTNRPRDKDQGGP